MDSKEFVGYNLAKELKDMGFDEDCLGFYYYIKTPMLTLCEPELYNKLEKHNLTLLKAPLWSQVFRWFMKKHNLMGIIDYDETDKSYFYYINFMDDMLSINYSKNYQTYEEAELECVINLITIIKEDKDETI